MTDQEIEEELREYERKCYHRYLEAKGEAEDARFAWSWATWDLVNFLHKEESP